ncbi:MAG: LysR family transcriptional regulator [Pseudomonas sp.]|uniref:LysR family transcriptional regulator n=1 Tax=Pseudomonas sp. TaxID=306 RepID=UPI0027360A6B|nr:LysR family transcriptional regulator [Pseudomonas sp.]MDP3847500.1 LysR family transcriptional regulator [Pseudomonas sp.]
MDKFQAMRVFTRIVELGAFGKAADSLQVPRASVTILIKQLEAQLGVQLLQRTTRHVQTTLDGAAYYQRCVQLLADLEDAEACFREGRQNPQGKLRVDLPSSLARLIVVPALPQFCARYPRIELEVGVSDRPVELIREGIDCVLRAGELHDSSLVARPLVQLRQLTCASPAYLQAHGVPTDLSQLHSHQAVNYFSALTGRRFDLEFQSGGELLRHSLHGPLAVNNADAYVAACEAGLGLIQVPYYHVAAQLKAGSLVEVLANCPPPSLPLTALYPAQRQLSRRVRVFVDWLVELFTQQDWH